MRLLWQEFAPIVAIATTLTAAKRLQPLCRTANATLLVPESLVSLEGTTVYRGSLKESISNLWSNHRAFIFCLATGAVVRLIAPLLEHKSRDPAIVVIDEAGKFVISLCSGHQGGADKLARLIAQQVGATAVLTGASAALELPVVDMLGIPFGWHRGEGNWTQVSAAVAKGEPVEVIQEAGSTLWQNHLPEKHSFDLGRAVDNAQSSAKAKIWISPVKRNLSRESELQQVQWHPRVLWVGIGCERGTSRQVIETAIREVMRVNQLAQEAIAVMATIDLKADEVGLVELCGHLNLPLRTFSAEVLRSVQVPTPSTVVKKEVGTPSVAEAAAILAGQVFSSLETIAQQLNSPDPPNQTSETIAQQLNPPDSPNQTSETITQQLNPPDPPNQTSETIAQQFQPSETEDRQTTAAVRLIVPKQIFRLEGQPGAVTVAIAQSPIEYTGRTGQLLLVGIGPGRIEQMTTAAQTAIMQADAIIGYSLYIDLISSLQRPGQIIEALPITQERQRAERAIQLATWGLTVAVISSGDCGIYGMAGLVLEQLQNRGWNGKTPGVEVLPGITALQAAAARVGAPLMHDFCAISLSDLLTPWEVIEKRLIAAAQADFVTALYNPRSQTRQWQIVKAQEIFLQYRHSETPVAIARSVYREDEQITVTTLAKFLEVPIDMMSVVSIGNQSTRIHSDWMITPRGYLKGGQ